VVELNQLKSLFELKLVPHNQSPFKNSWLINPYRDLMRLAGLKIVNAISVNQITTSRQMIKFYRSRFNAAIESMEGAALHYVCLMEKIPFIQLRSISNYIGERNKDKWNMKESINNLNNELIRFIKTLTS
jgi:futalosine hydrolase